MHDVPVSPWLMVGVGVLWLASGLTWVAIFEVWRRGRILLSHVPRKPVPWGAAIGLLAVLFVAVSILPGLFAEAVSEPAEQAHAEDVEPPPEPPQVNLHKVFQQLVGFIVFQSFLTVGVVVAVAVIYQPSARDFGLPLSVRELVRDVWLGIVAWLAAIIPVHGLQIFFLFLFGLQEEPPTHPLIEMVAPAGPSVLLFMLAAIVAVIIAPISEELLFRLLFQGWLEKWEAIRVTGRTAAGEPEAAIDTDLPLGPFDQAPVANEELSGTEDASFDTQDPRFPAAAPDRGIAGWPYGWVPIVVSSLLFAVAHIGHGPDPFAIFVLALILGYVYQRTHRIIPCIVAHMLFNGLAMFVLWQMIFFNAE